MTERLLLLKEVSVVVGLSGQTIWRLRKKGSFPAPLQLSENRIAFRRSDIDAWIEARGRAYLEASPEAQS